MTRPITEKLLSKCGGDTLCESAVSVYETQLNAVCGASTSPICDRYSTEILPFDQLGPSLRRNLGSTGRDTMNMLAGIESRPSQFTLRAGPVLHGSSDISYSDAIKTTKPDGTPGDSQSSQPVNVLGGEVSGIWMPGQLSGLGGSSVSLGVYAGFGFMPLSNIERPAVGVRPARTISTGSVWSFTLGVVLERPMGPVIGNLFLGLRPSYATALSAGTRGLISDWFSEVNIAASATHMFNQSIGVFLDVRLGYSGNFFSSPTGQGGQVPSNLSRSEAAVGLGVVWKAR